MLVYHRFCPYLLTCICCVDVYNIISTTGMYSDGEDMVVGTVTCIISTTCAKDNHILVDRDRGSYRLCCPNWITIQLSILIYALNYKYREFIAIDIRTCYATAICGPHSPEPALEITKDHKVMCSVVVYIHE